MIDFIRRHKVACWVVLLDVVAILIAILVLVYNSAKTATVEIFVAPIGARIELNDTKYENFKSYDILPGEYHVKISMDGMQTKEYDLDISEGEFKRVRAFLLDDEGGFNYYRSHYDDELILEEIADTEEAKGFVAKYARVRGILDVLPIEYSAYVDDYSEYSRYEIVQGQKEDCNKMICLKIIDNTGGNEKKAIERIREVGYDPDNYEITYELNVNESVRTEDE